MWILEVKKIKRSKLNIILSVILLLNITLMFFLGTISFGDYTYGDTVSWYFEQNLDLNSYYLFIPIFTLIGVELFLLEKNNKTYFNLLSLPLDVSKLIMAKLTLLFIVCIGYTFVLFCEMTVFEVLKHGYADWHYIGIYMIHGIVSYIISVSIILLLLYFKQSMMAGIMISFMLSFFSVLIASLKYAWLYPVNGMYYLSGVIPSTMIEKIGIIIILVCLMMLSKYLVSKVSVNKLLNL